MTPFDRFEQNIDAMYGVSLLEFVLLASTNREDRYALCQSEQDCLKRCWFPLDRPMPDGWFVIKDSLLTEKPYVPKFDKDYNGRTVVVDSDGSKILNGR
jgi:hypothetical protein